VLVLLPPSESKAPPAARGKPLDLAVLSFPALTATRERVLDAVAAVSAGPDAVRRLGADRGHGVEHAFAGGGQRRERESGQVERLAAGGRRGLGLRRRQQHEHDDAGYRRRRPSAPP